MATLRTCRTCASAAEPCAARDGLQAAIRGLGIQSLKHRCAAFRPVFSPGDPLDVLTRAWMGAPPTQRDYAEDEPPQLWFSGHFVNFAGGKLLVFVAPGTVSPDNPDYPFEPSAGGFVKAPLSRVRPRPDGERADVEACRWCAAIIGLGVPCGFDPVYTPVGDCLLAARSAVTQPSRPSDGEGLSAAARSPTRPNNPQG